jgi:hypothetical protein
MPSKEQITNQIYKKFKLMILLRLKVTNRSQSPHHSMHLCAAAALQLAK